uniref:Putative secreted protein n=1 Tax=Anopheles darlingi TaxID=43151 RepID=A0A2M4D4P7_ANODA
MLRVPSIFMSGNTLAASCTSFFTWATSDSTSYPGMLVNCSSPANICSISCRFSGVSNGSQNSSWSMSSC